MRLFMNGLLVASLFFTTIAARASEYAQHPQPHDPVFLDKSFYTELSKALPPPPQSGSTQQKSDEQTLLMLQSKRTKTDCERANSEALVDFDAFFRKPSGPLTKDELDQIRSLITEVDQDAYYFINKLKKEYPRERPFLYVAKLQPCVPKEKTLAYPSGHAAVSALIAMVAGDIFPAKAESLKHRAELIANDRVLGGVHHPSDIASGKIIASAIYEKLQKTKLFREAIQKTKRETVLETQENYRGNFE